jgi:hypothetical protein
MQHCIALPLPLSTPFEHLVVQIEILTRRRSSHANVLDEAHLADRMSSMSLTFQEREAVGRARRGSHSSR